MSDQNPTVNINCYTTSSLAWRRKAVRIITKHVKAEREKWKT